MTKITHDEKKQALHLLRYNDMHNFADEYMKNEKLLELYRIRHELSLMEKSLSIYDELDKIDIQIKELEAELND